MHSELILANQPNCFCVTKKEIMLLINRFHQMLKEQDYNSLRIIILDFVGKIKITDKSVDVVLKLTFGNVSIGCISRSTSKNACNTFKSDNF